MAHSDEDYRAAMLAYCRAFLAANGKPCRISRGEQFIHISSDEGRSRIIVRMKKLRQMTDVLNERAASARLPASGKDE